MSTLRVEQADITKLEVDAIVNAANARMLGGGGVDGAIHRAAGPELLEACRRIPELRPGVRCPTGEARITPGFRLPARFVIHTVGPIWRGGAQGEATALAACYQSTLALCGAHELTSVAFPAISCGAFGFPLREACAIAVREVRAALDSGLEMDAVVLVAMGSEVYASLSEALRGAG